LLEFFQRHVYPIPQYKQDLYSFSLIFGVWSSVDGFGLFQSSDTTVAPVVKHGEGHCTIGSGFSVVEYALGLTYQPGLSVEDAKFIAPLCIKAAKDYVDYCGGKTHVYTLKDTPPHRIHKVIPVEVRAAEEYSVELFDLVKYILNYLDTERYGDEIVGGMLDVLKDSIKEFRTVQRERKERIRKARERGKPQPKPTKQPVP